jgi:hypothetical protein
MVDLPRSRIAIRLPRPPPATASTAAAPTRREIRSAPELAVGFHLRAGAALAAGWLPGVALGVGVEAGVAPHPRARVSIRGGFFPPWDSDASRGGLHTWAFHGSVAVAARLLAIDRFWVDTRLALGVGMFETESTGVMIPVRSQGPLVDVRIGLEAGLIIAGPWELVLDVGAGAPFLLHRFEVVTSAAATEAVFESPPAFLAASLWLQMRFPSAAVPWTGPAQ